MPCRSHVRRLASRKARLAAYGATVVAVGPGTRQSAERLAASLETPIPVLADETGSIVTKFGFSKVVLGLIRQSGTLIVDRDGVVRYAHRVTNPAQALDEQGLFLALRHL